MENLNNEVLENEEQLDNETKVDVVLEEKDGILKDGTTGEPEKVELMDLLEDKDVHSQFQAEVDRRITQAIQTRERKHQEELKRQEQRSKMTVEELQAEKERELLEREQEIKNYEMRIAKVDYFKENNIPLDLIDYVVVDDTEDIESKTEVLMKLINTEVDKLVKKQLRDNGIGIGETETNNKLSLEELSRLSPEEINKHWDSL